MDNLKDITFQISDEKLMFSEDDVNIVDYMVDHHGKDIMKSFDSRPENTGVAIFFDDKECRTMVVVLRMKYFEDRKDNGLIMFVIENLFKNHLAVQALIEIINKAFKKDSHLKTSIIHSIDVKVLKSIDKNA